MSTDDSGWAEPTPVPDNLWATPTQWQTPTAPAVPGPPLPTHQPVQGAAGARRRFSAGMVAMVTLASLAVVGLTIAALAMVTRGNTQPSSESVATANGAEQATGSPAAEPTRDPTDYATAPDGLASPGKLTKDSRLPSHALPLGGSFLTDAQAGRALGIYDVHTKDQVDGAWIDNPGPVVLYLATGPGELRQVLELPRGPEYELVYWQLGEPTALVALWEPGADGPFSGPPPQYRTLDLLTGDLSDPNLGALASPYLRYLGDLKGQGSLWVQSDVFTPEFSIFAPQRVVVRAPSGEVTVIAELPITRPHSSFLVSPGMQQLAIQGSYGQPTVTVDLATGAVDRIYPSLDPTVECNHVGWFNDTSLFRTCEESADGSEYGALSRVSLFTGDEIETVLTYDTQRGQDLDFGPQAVHIKDNIIHTMAAPEIGYTCRNGLFYVGDDDYSATGWTNLDAEEHTQYRIVGDSGSKVYALKIGDCPQGPWLAELSVLDVNSDTVTVLFPALALPRDQITQSPGLISTFVAR